MGKYLLNMMLKNFPVLKVVLPAGGDKTIARTGKRFRFPMVTVGHWEGGKMKEEYIFYDNLGILKQIGLAQ